MKKLCIGGPLDGKQVDSDDYFFPYTQNMADVPECDRSRELETTLYKTTALIDDIAGVVYILIPISDWESPINTILTAYRESRDDRAASIRED